jgi:hypothetical protein
MTTRLSGIVVGGPPEPWAALGFAVDDRDHIRFANGALRLSGAGAGLLGLVVDGIPTAGVSTGRRSVDLEGVPVTAGDVEPGADHPNGAFELDHVVLRTPHLDDTSAAVEAVLGLACRRVRETSTVRQAFHRFPDQGGVRGCIVEVVEDERATVTTLWGLVVNVADLDAAVDELGPEVIGDVKPAVQAGRGIATVRRDAGLGVPVALMSPA